MKTDECSLVAEDQMIEHRDAEQLVGLHQALRDGPVLGTGRQVVPRMVVKQDPRGSVTGDSGLEDLAGVHDGSIEGTYQTMAELPKQQVR